MPVIAFIFTQLGLQAKIKMNSKDVPKYLEKMSDVDHINQLNKGNLERLDYAVDPNHPI